MINEPPPALGEHCDKEHFPINKSLLIRISVVAGVGCLVAWLLFGPGSDGVVVLISNTQK